MAAHDDIKSPREDTPLLQQESPGQATPKAPLPSWLQTLIDAFSCKLLFTVVCTQHVLKGFVAGGGDSGLLGAPMEFLFKEYRVHGGRMQVYMAVAVSPWALKPVIGLLSDTCPIFGYQKMPYIVISLVAGLIAVLVLGLYGANLELSELICCLFVAFFAVSSVDLLVKAAQSSKVKKAVHLSHDFFLFTWLGIVVGMIASALLVGPLLHYWSPRHCYLVALPFLGLSLWPALANYLGEQPLPLEDRTQLMAANFRKHPEMFILALCMALVLIGIVIATLTLSKEKDVEFPQFMMSFVGACIILASLAIFIRWEITGPCIFWFILQACPRVDGALFFFYTDGPDVFPGGPFFSPWLYATGMNLACFCGTLCAYLTGDFLFKEWRYPSIILLTVPLRVVARLMLIPVLWRWTIPSYADSEASFILALEFLHGMCFAWSWIPRQVMTAHATPTGYEATMLSLMSGTFNMASMISSYCGCWILSNFSVCVDGSTDDAKSLARIWKPYTVSSVSPLLALVLLPILIPNKYQTEVLITEKPESSTHGSFFTRRFRSLN